MTVPGSAGAPATQAGREHVVAEIMAAVEDGRLDVAEGGRRLSAAYRTPTAGGLSALVADLPPEAAPAVPAGHRRRDRAQYLWAAAGIVACAVLAAVLLVLVLRGLSPTVLR